MKSILALLFIALYAVSTSSTAQNAIKPPTPNWQQCSALTGDSDARLRCFDAWAARQSGLPTPHPQAASATPLATDRPKPAKPTPPPATVPVVITMVAPAVHDCKSPRS